MHFIENSIMNLQLDGRRRAEVYRRGQSSTQLAAESGQSLKGNGIASLANATNEAICFRYKPRLPQKRCRRGLSSSLKTANTNCTNAVRTISTQPLGRRRTSTASAGRAPLVCAERGWWSARFRSYRIPLKTGYPVLRGWRCGVLIWVKGLDRSTAQTA